MRKLLATVALVLCAAALGAQEVSDAQKAAAQAAAAYAGANQVRNEAPKPVYWTNSVQTNINFIQSSYTKWAKGGYNNYTMSAYVDANANYKKDNFTWNNRLQLDYGFLYSEDKPILQKNKDRILLESTVGSQVRNSFSYTAKFTFLSQFSDGFIYATPSVEDPQRQDWKDARMLKSSLFSPAVANLGLGFDWSPKKWLKINFAPLTGGFTIVAEESLRKTYGMELKKGHSADEVQQEAGGLVGNGDIFRGARFEFGAQLSLDAKATINENFTAATQLILFSNYLKNPQNMRVNWDNRFMWKVAKYFSINLSTSLLYDDTVSIFDEEHPDGFRAVQFYEALQFGFTYTFATKK